MSLGKRLAYFRKREGLTQSQLGEYLSVSPQAVSKWENDFAEPDLRTLKQLAAVYHITVDELLADEESVQETAAASSAERGITAPVPLQEDNKAALSLPQENNKKLVGYCVRCGCAVYRGSEVRTSQGILCNMCNAERKRAAAARRYASSAAYRPSVPARKERQYNDMPSFGWALLSFLIPIVGIILFAVFCGNYPLRAKSCLKGFIVGIIVEILLPIMIVGCAYWLSFAAV